jgi:dTMP kinase
VKGFRGCQHGAEGETADSDREHDVSYAVPTALAFPAFRRIWTAMLVSSIGDWAGILAATLLVARMAGEDRAAWAVAAVMAARIAAILTVGPIAGVLADRFDRRRALITADLGRCVLTALLPVAGHIGVVVVLMFGLESLGLLWGPSLDATVPNLVAPDALPGANALRVLAAYGTMPLGALVLTFSVAASAASDGFFSQHVEAVALWVDAATFLVSAALVASLGSDVLDPGRHRRRTKVPPPSWASVSDEFRYLRDHDTTRNVVLGLAIGFLGASAVTSLGPLLVLFVLDTDPAVYGVMVGVLGVGVITGAAAASRRLDGRSLTAMRRALAGAGIALGGMSLVSQWPVAAALAVATGVGAGVAVVVGYTALQTGVADDHRARTFAALTVIGRSLLIGGRLLFPAFVGALGALVDDRATATRVGLALAGAIVTAASFVALRRVRT